MNDQRPLYIPVILGTTRSGRMSAAAATLMVAEIAKRPGVTTDLIDIATISLPVDDAGETIKDSRFKDTAILNCGPYFQPGRRALCISIPIRS